MPSVRHNGKASELGMRGFIILMHVPMQPRINQKVVWKLTYVNIFG